MARGNTKREGRAARSELPSGVEATRDDIRALGTEIKNAEMRKKYAETFKTNKDVEYQESKTGFKFGDGVVGNGIIKNGELHLRDEDIKDIVESNFLAGDQRGIVEESIDNGGGIFYYFAPFTGKGNEGSETMNGYSVAYNTHAIDLPDGNDTEVTDFKRGEPRTYEEPGSPSYGSLSIPDSDVSSKVLKVEYEQVTGIPMENSSAVRLAKAITKAIDKIGAGFAERKSEEYDFDEYDNDRRNERDL